MMQGRSIDLLAFVVESLFELRFAQSDIQDSIPFLHKALYPQESIDVKTRRSVE